MLLFAPLISPTFLENFGSSLDLYFQKFEFNASIYYCFRWVGQLISGYNLISFIGPILGLTTLALISFLAVRKKIVDVAGMLNLFILAFTAYLFLGTTIHPWYLSIPILLSVFTSFRFPIIWSLLIMFTYLSYGNDPFYENLWIVALEYIFVFLIYVVELRLHSKNQEIATELLKITGRQSPS